MTKSPLLAGLSLVVLLSSSCSLGSLSGRSAGSVKTSPSEIDALKAQVLELQKRAAIADVEIARLQRRLAQLESGDTTETVAKPGPREVPTISDGKAPVGNREQVSDVEVSDLPPKSKSPPPSPPSAEGTGKGGNSLGQAATLTASAQALYDRGYTLFHRGRYVDSETAFQQFLSGYAATVLGDNAQFWIAEARHARGDLEGALAAYQETASRFPDGNKAPDALLKAGDCALELEDTEGARESFRRLLSEFPGSSAAVAARERLARLP